MFGIRKDLPAKERINVALLRLYETGILNYAKDKFAMAHVPECHDFGTVGYKEVSMSYVYGAYLLLGTGYAAALAICLLEVWARKGTTLIL